VRWLLFLAGSATAVAAVLAYAFDISLMTDDTAQYVSVARHLLAGEGLKTNLIYFQSHFDLGGVPVPETTWPPGFPILIAIVATFGIPVEVVPFFLSLAALVTTAFLIYVLSLICGSSKGTAVAAGIAWLSFVFAWPLALGGTTELTFALMSISTIYAAALSTSGNRISMLWLALAGIFAACAFAIRYQGIFLIFSLGSWCFFRTISTHSWRDVKRLIVVAIAPCLAVALIFGRNVCLTGKITTNSYNPVEQSLLGAIRELYWAVSNVFGIPDLGFIYTLLIVLLVVSAVLVMFAISCIGRQCRTEAAELIVIISSTYVLVTMMALFYFTLTRTAGFINERYLLPLIPHMIVVVVAGGVRFGQIFRFRIDKNSIRLMIVAGLAILITGQSQVLRSQLRWYLSQHTYSDIEGAIDARFGNQTVRSYLLENIDAAGPLLAQDAQHLGIILDRPVIGLPAPLYTDTIWDDARVKEIVDAYDVSHVAFFPSLLSRKSEWNRNRVLFADLERGKVPVWLDLVYSDEYVVLYEVRDAS